MLQLVANLDCEATWAARPQPTKIRQRLATMSILLRGLVTDDEVQLHTIVAPNLEGVVDVPGLPALRWTIDPRDGTTWPAAAGFAWAGSNAVRRLHYDPGHVPWRAALLQAPVSDAVAKAANDRRLTLAVRQQAGVELPAAAVISSAAGLRAHIVQHRAQLGPGGWVCKAPWTAAGRDRVWGHDLEDTALQRAATLLRSCGALVFEPWLPRLLDYGVLATVDASTVTQRPPHTLLCNAHGGFTGIDMSTPEMTVAERDQIISTVDTAGLALRTLGYLGPFTIDGFFYQHQHGRALAPLCEINARLSFGWVALALTTRLGGTALQIGATAPTTARMLLHPTQRDPFAVWIE